jgi:hypothetical protein
MIKLFVMPKQTQSEISICSDSSLADIFEFSNSLKEPEPSVKYINREPLIADTSKILNSLKESESSISDHDPSEILLKKINDNASYENAILEKNIRNGISVYTGKL